MKTATKKYDLAEQERTYQIRLEELRKEIQKGMDSGGDIPAEEVYAELRARNKEQRRKGV